MIHFSCPHCKARLNVPDEYGGQKADCPKCEKPLIVPPAEDIPMGIRDGGSEPDKVPLALEITAPKAGTPEPTASPAPPESTDEEPTFGLKDDHAETPPSAPQATTRPSKLKIPELKEKSYEVPKLRGGGGGGASAPPSGGGLSAPAFGPTPPPQPTPPPAPTPPPMPQQQAPSSLSSLDDDFEFKLAGEPDEPKPAGPAQPQQQPAPPRAAPQQAPSADEKVAFKCPSCGVGINVPAKLGGRQAKCPKCKAPIEIPMSSSILQPVDVPGTSAPPAKPAASAGDYVLADEKPAAAAPGAAGLKLTRCVKCGFDYPAAVSECPKCGFDASKESRGRMGAAPTQPLPAATRKASGGADKKKLIIMASVAVVVLLGGFFAYRQWFAGKSADDGGKTTENGGNDTTRTPGDTPPPKDSAIRIASTPPTVDNAKPDDPLLRYTGEGTLAYIHVGRASELQQALNKTALKSIYENPQAKKAIDGLVKKRLAGPVEALAKVGLELPRAFVADFPMTTLITYSRGNRGRRREQPTTAVNILDLSANSSIGQALAKALTDLNESARKRGGQVGTHHAAGKTVYLIQGLPYRQRRLPGGADGPSPNLAWCRDGNALLLSDTVAGIEAALNAPGEKLGNDRGFLEALRHVHSDTVIALCYLKLGALINLEQSDGASIGNSPLDAAWSIGQQADGLLTSVYVGGLPKDIEVLPRESFDQQLLDAVPANASFFAAVRLDLRSLLKLDPARVVKDILEDVPGGGPGELPPDDPGMEPPRGGGKPAGLPFPPGFGPEAITAMIEQFDKTYLVGSALTRAIGGDVLVVQIPRPESRESDTVLALPLVDVKAFERFEENLIDKMGLKPVTRPATAFDAKVLPKAAQGKDIVYAVFNDWLYLAPSIEAMNNYMQFRAYNEGQSVREAGMLSPSEAFVGTSGFVYTLANTSAHLNRLSYSLAGVLKSDPAAKKLGLNAFPTPALRNIEAGPTVMSAWRRGETFVLKVFSPAGLPVHAQLVEQAIQPTLAGLAAEDDVAVTDNKQALEKLRFLALACNFYAEQHGSYPASLARLHPQFIDDLKLFVAPAQSNVTIGNARLIDRLSGYRLNPAVAGRPKNEVRPTEVVIMEKPELHRNRGTNVGLANGTTKWLPRNQFGPEME